MYIHHDLENITKIAMHDAQKHMCNYNIILMNPDSDGEFSIIHGSTYECKG